MKKLLLTFLTLTSFYGAQSQILYSQNFENIPGPTAGGAGTYAFPSGFLIMNVDNRTPSGSVSYVNEAWERREDFNFNVADSAAFSTSWYSPAGAADDWMWTPLIGPITANTNLSWNAVTYDALYPDGYEVRIMTSAGGPPTGGTGVIGNQLTNSTQVFSIVAENTAWTARNLSLSAYAGQSIYVGFRNTSNDKFLLLIDDILVENMINFDAQLVSTDTITEYSLIPITQVAPMNFSGDIRNNGVNALTNVMLNVNVKNSSNISVYAASSAPAGLASGATSTFTVAPFTPSVVDDYSVTFYTSATETDQLNSNDTLMDYFTITDTVYARDWNAITGGLGIGAGNGGYIGQDFEVITADELTSVTMAYTRGYTGKPCAAVIWDMVAGVPNAIIASTDTLLYPDDSARVYTLDIYGGSINLLPGRYAVTAVEFDSTLSLAQTAEIFTTNRTWITWPTSPMLPWANAEDFGAGFAKPFVIRPNFGIVCNLAASLVGSTNISCYGSNDGAATVTSTGGIGSVSYLWSNGMTGTSTSNLLPGFYSVYVEDIQGCKDTVYLTISEPAQVVSSQTLTICAGDSVVVGTITHNTSGLFTDVLTGAAANGCDSTVTTNLTVSPAVTSSQTLVFCAGGSVVVGTVTHNTTGIYVDTLVAAAVNGCDSIVTTDLTVNGVIDVSTSLVGSTVSANATSGTFQWLDCDNGSAVIGGETNQSFSPSVTGNYAVVVTENSCSDTSACVLVTVVGIAQQVASTEALNIYPNPSTGTFVIKARTEGTYTIYNELGQVVKTIELSAKNNYTVTISDLSNGVYIISGVTANKVVKQKIVIKK
ncbi:MAG: choice-of-anchor J domain-containing protein [Bacteroidota bacterium]|nr:choice-of-anchor J domain-containing protein [Bacteroidota bacterium]